MKTFVSKEGLLALTSFIPVEFEPRRKRPFRVAQTPQCLCAARIAGNLKLSFARNRNLDLVALLQVRASTSPAGKRTAKLFPHLKICIDVR